MISAPAPPAPARLLACALVLAGALGGLACDERPGAAPTAAVDRPASQPASEELFVKAAALRHLMAEQPLAADRAAFAAYLVRDPAAAPLAQLLASAPPAGGPPVVGALDVYVRKGRTMDLASGRPVKVFQARFAPAPAPDGQAEVHASWQAGRLAGAAYRYQLRKEGGGWVVTGRAPETP